MQYLFINNEKVKYKFCWISADNLITNANQTRDRSQISSTAQINIIADNLQAELLSSSYEMSTGAPVVDSNNAIISGHGRVLAIKTAFYNNNAKYCNYINYLSNNVLNINNVGSICFILCRVIDSKHNNINSVHSANISTLSYSNFELAKINAQRLKPTLEQFVINLPKNEQSQYFNDGCLNNKAHDDFLYANIMNALPDCNILHDFINFPHYEFKNVISAVLKNIDKIKEIKNTELYFNFCLALDKFAQVKKNNNNIEDFIYQLDIFDDKLNNPNFLEFMRIFNENTRSANKLSSELATYLHKKTTEDLFSDSDFSKNTTLCSILSHDEKLQKCGKNTKIYSDNVDKNISEKNIKIFFDSSTPPLFNNIKVRDWQARSLIEMNQALDNNIKKMLISAPTGAGKAFLLMLIIEQFIKQGKRIILLVDRIKLVSQLSQSAKKFNIDHDLIVGNKKQIAANLLTIASVQSFYKLQNKPIFDVVLVDECHTIYKQITQYIDDHAGIVIGCTATPTTKDLKLHYPHLISTITQLELEKNKILVPLEIKEQKYIDMEGARVVAGEWTAEEIFKRCQSAFDDWIIDVLRFNIFKYNHSLAFCASIYHCLELKQRLSQYDINSEVYTSMQSNKDREKIMAKFESGEIKILITVATLSKGFDCDLIDSIIDLRPLRKSVSEYIQMIGRGTRTREGKNKCTVLDFSGNWERFKDIVTKIHADGVESVYNDTLDKGIAIQSKKNTPQFIGSMNTFRRSDLGNNLLKHAVDNQQIFIKEHYHDTIKNLSNNEDNTLELMNIKANDLYAQREHQRQLSKSLLNQGADKKNIHQKNNGFWGKLTNSFKGLIK